MKNFNYFQHSELEFPVSDQFHWRGPWPQYINFSPTESNGNNWLVKKQNAIYGKGIIGQISSPKQFWKQKKRYLKWIREVFQKNKMETPLFYFATESRKGRNSPKSDFRRPKIPPEVRVEHTTYSTICRTPVQAILDQNNLTGSAGGSGKVKIWPRMRLALKIQCKTVGFGAL